MKNPSRTTHALRRLRAPLSGLTGGVCLSVFCAAPVLGDDTEIFVGDTQGARPNILLIFDTSGSMNTGVTGERDPYDPGRVYSGTCRADVIYWRSGTGPQPSCTDVTAGANNYFDADQLVCAEAVRAIAAAGFSGRGLAAQWDPDAGIWTGIDPEVKDQPVECAIDSGVHGPNAADARRYPADVDQWTATEAQRFTYQRANTNVAHRFYSSNWLNWLQSPPAARSPSRMAVAQAAARALVQTTSGVNIGLMRYSNNEFSPGGPPSSAPDTAAEGGMVVFPVSPVETSRESLVEQIDDFESAGLTPLSETLFEARQYFAGDAVVYGLGSRTSPGTAFESVPESRNGNQYLSPADAQCQRNFIVYLTDGEPTADRSAEGRIESLIGGACDDEDNGEDDGRCLDDLAGYMFDRDQRPDLGPSPAAGMQNVTTYTVGFGPDVAGSQLLAETAERGGGEAFDANDSVELTAAFDNIIADVEEIGTTFVAPAVAVNAFNRTETLSEVYLSMFKPGDSYRWAGNLKKYRLVDGALVDADGEAAVDDEGLIDEGARSIWSPQTDGSVVELGGAANRLPDPATRNLYTFLGNDDLTDPSNAVRDGNASLTDTLLGLGQPGQPTRADLIDWARGADVGDRIPGSDVRNSMGDPLHSRPAVVVYGGSAANPDTVVFIATNDGYLHAVDGSDSDGRELWSFIPPQLLNRLPSLFANEESAAKQYGLDGDVRALRIDVDRDGIIEPADGDKVYLYFGMGRGGSNYYALDVTDKNDPRHLWTLTPADLPGVGQTWAPAQFTRVNIDTPALNDNKLVIVFGGGYDPTQDDDQSSTLYRTDSVGNRIYMVDAEDGDLLWYAGGAGIGDPDLDLPRMNNSIPSAPRIVDLDNDGFADRMYAADTGGRVWRFDIIVDANPTLDGVQVPSASQLVTGGRMATLGAADSEAGSGNAATRRFYNTPDVALIRRRGADLYFNVALGSGWRGHPLNTQTQDHFYSLRDYAPFNKFTQAQANTRDADPIVVGDLVDVTTNLTPSIPSGNAGWRLELRLPTRFEGEKVLAESRTFNNQVFFPTYLPRANGGGCAPIGSNRVYAVNVDNGSPVQDINRDGETTPTDRYTDLVAGGIAPALSFFFNRRLVGDTDGDGEDDDNNGDGIPDQYRATTCTSGWVDLSHLCENGATVTRTYWRASQ